MRYFITGGAGFIGSHLTEALLSDESNQVVVFDNFSSGKRWHLKKNEVSPRLKVIEADIKDQSCLQREMQGTDVVYHFAANPDIARAMKQPDIDFYEGTLLVNNVIESARVNGVQKIMYASGSGVYGDKGQEWVKEEASPLLPISTYGASKLGCEALLCSYAHMFAIQAHGFRFANVIGPRQTHGVAYDFIRRLKKNPHELVILGNGLQSKSYLHVSDVVNAMQLVEKKDESIFSVYNVSTDDFLSVNDIAQLTAAALDLKNVRFNYTGGDRGWKGDVPVVRLNSDKIKSLGWQARLNSLQGMKESITSLLEDYERPLDPQELGSHK